MKADQEPDFILIDPQAGQSLKKTATTISGDEDYEDESSFFLFANGENRKQVTLDPYDPKNKHLVVVPGVNFKAKCDNQKCQAYKHGMTWIQGGYGTFQLPKTFMGRSCMGCKDKIKVKSFHSLGYSRAKVVMTGLKLNGDNQVEISQQFEERKGKFIYFRDQDDDLQKFLCLTIKVTKSKSNTLSTINVKQNKVRDESLNLCANFTMTSPQTWIAIIITLG